MEQQQKTDAIWRYMSAVELLTILDRRKLVFRQFRCLMRNDRAEGSLPDDFTELGDLWREDPQALQKGLIALETLRHCCYVQCWHRNDKEHSALWRIYADRGVAVRTTISKLQSSHSWSAASLRGDDVVYADSWHELKTLGFNYPEGIVPNRLFLRTKRRPFAWEQEWRVTMQPPPPHGFITPAMNLQQKQNWLSRWPGFFEVEMRDLDWIEAVVVDRRIAYWAFETICSLAVQHNVHCERSKL